MPAPALPDYVAREASRVLSSPGVETVAAGGGQRRPSITIALALGLAVALPLLAAHGAREAAEAHPLFAIQEVSRAAMERVNQTLVLTTRSAAEAREADLAMRARGIDTAVIWSTLHADASAGARPNAVTIGRDGVEVTFIGPDGSPYAARITRSNRVERRDASGVPVHPGGGGSLLSGQQGAADGEPAAPQPAPRRG